MTPKKKKQKKTNFFFCASPKKVENLKPPISLRPSLEVGENLRSSNA